MTNKKNTLSEGRLPWFTPRIVVLNVNETQMKRRTTNFEGGNRPTNPCLDMSHPNYNPNLNRCFRRGPS